MVTKIKKDAKILIGLPGNPKENEEAYKAYIKQLREIEQILENFKDKIYPLDISKLNEDQKKIFKLWNKISGRGENLYFPIYLIDYTICSNSIHEFIQVFNKIHSATNKYVATMSFLLVKEDPDLEETYYTLKEFLMSLEDEIENEKIFPFVTLFDSHDIEDKNLRKKVEEYCSFLYGSPKLILPIFVAHVNIIPSNVEEFLTYYRLLNGN